VWPVIVGGYVPKAYPGHAAADFFLFLAVPTMLGATLKEKSYEFINACEDQHLTQDK